MSVAIRTATVDDLSALYRNVLETVRAGVGVVMVPEDVGSVVEFATRTLPSLAEGGRDGFMVVAEADDAVVGAAGIRRFRPSMVRHVGSLGIEVRPSHQKRGIGALLLDEVERRARAASITRLELSVRADNAAALRLYERTGFVRELTRARFVRLPSGEYLDDFGYVKFLAAD
jgi:ribosomal protein S18 acetylase RimI-like enzyme